MVAFAKAPLPAHRQSRSLFHAERFSRSNYFSAGRGTLTSRTNACQNRRFSYDSCLSPSLAQGSDAGTRIAVIFNGSTLGQRTGGSGATSSGNPGGHVAIAVEGKGIYSYGNNTTPGSSTTEYLASQALRRDSVVVIINTNSDQHSSILSALSAENRSMGILNDNCATICNDALKAGGLSLRMPGAFYPMTGYSPSYDAGSLPWDTLRSAYINKNTLWGEIIRINRSQNPSIPDSLNPFDPGG